MAMPLILTSTPNFFITCCSKNITFLARSKLDNLFFLISIKALVRPTVKHELEPMPLLAGKSPSRGSAKKFFLGSSSAFILFKRMIFLTFSISVIRLILRFC